MKKDILLEVMKKKRAAMAPSSEELDSVDTKGLLEDSKVEVEIEPKEENEDSEMGDGDERKEAMSDEQKYNDVSPESDSEKEEVMMALKEMFKNDKDENGLMGKVKQMLFKKG